MEEAVGDCTNLHISYPTLVYGFLHVIKANRQEECPNANDTAVLSNGSVVDSIMRYHDTMARLTNRMDVRNEASRYEAVALALVNTSAANRGELIINYPQPDSLLLYERFFPTLYRMYDLRFVYTAPALKPVTERLAWQPDSPALALPEVIALQPRIA